MWSAKYLRITGVIIKRIFGLTLTAITLYIAWLEFGESLIKDLFHQNERLTVHYFKDDFI